MIICESYKDMGDGTVKVDLTSDTKDEITEPLTGVKGLPDGTKLAINSTITVIEGGDYAIRRSYNAWEWQ